MVREQAPATGGAEATLKRIDYIEEEAENVQFAIWALSLIHISDPTTQKRIS